MKALIKNLSSVEITGTVRNLGDGLEFEIINSDQSRSWARSEDLQFTPGDLLISYVARHGVYEVPNRVQSKVGRIDKVIHRKFAALDCFYVITPEGKFELSMIPNDVITQIEEQLKGEMEYDSQI